MTIELWSRKQGLIRPPERLLYAEKDGHRFPKTFRKRAYIWAQEAFRSIEFRFEGSVLANNAHESWSRLYQGLSAAYGRLPLVPLAELGHVADRSNAAAMPQLSGHVLVCPDNEVIDFIDAVFQVGAEVLQADGHSPIGSKLQEIGRVINGVFEEEGIGYRWVAGQILRYDEGATHELAIKPAVELLRGGRFGEANSEFSDALDAYRAGRWRDAITNANAAFESVLKVQTGKSGLTAGPLIREAREQGVIPKYLGAAVENLEKLMHAAPATRGAEAAHGQGDRPSEANQHLAQLIISVVASFILFLARPKGSQAQAAG